MFDYHLLFTGHYIDLLLILLAFVAGRSIQYKESLYLIIFLLKLGVWIAKKMPKKEQKHIHTKLSDVLDHILSHHKNLLHDTEANGVG